MGPVNRRLVFAALVAYTDRPTTDGRVLVTPPGFMCPARDYPLPVFGRDEEFGMAYRVGDIEAASVVDHRLIAFGRMYTTGRAKMFTDQLRDGTHRLEIDVTALETARADRDDQVTVIARWELASAYIGDRPCWNLPPVQMEDMTCL